MSKRIIKYFSFGGKIYYFPEQDLTPYAKKTDIPDISGLQNYDDTDIKNRLTTLEAIDHTKFATKDDLTTGCDCPSINVVKETDIPAEPNSNIYFIYDEN